MNSPVTVSSSDAWASGNHLIVGHAAVLPAICIKCGRPAEPQPVNRRFRWHPPWMYVLIIVGLLIYVIVAAIASKHISIKLPLCRRHGEKYRTLGWASAILLLGAIPEMIVAGTYLPDSQQGYGILAGFVAIAAGLACLILHGSILRPSEINAQYGQFSGADRSFLQYLPLPTRGAVFFR